MNIIKMPSNFIEVKDDEMDYLFGSFNWFGLLSITTAVIGVLVCFVPAAAPIGFLVACLGLGLTIGSLL